MERKQFEAICEEIMSPSLPAEPSLAFSLLCVLTGIDRDTADNIFYEKMGMSCEEAIEACQKGVILL